MNQEGIERKLKRPETRGSKDRAKVQQQQPFKTRLCVFHLAGRCQYGTRCTFAHAPNELVVGKAYMCPHQSYGTCTDVKCRFAHSVAELSPLPKQVKTSMCKYWPMGKCRAGAACRHAHTVEELDTKTFDSFDVSQLAPQIKKCERLTLPPPPSPGFDASWLPTAPATTVTSPTLQALQRLSSFTLDSASPAATLSVDPIVSLLLQLGAADYSPTTVANTPAAFPKFTSGSQDDLEGLMFMSTSPDDTSVSTSQRTPDQLRSPLTSDNSGGESNYS